MCKNFIYGEYIIIIFGIGIDVVNEEKCCLTSKSDMDLGQANIILGVKILRSDSCRMLTQEHYVNMLLKKYGYFDVTYISTSYDANTQ